MSLTADLDGARLSVLLDVRHPHAYLALGPAIAFGKSQQLVVNWLPLATPTLKSPSTPGPDDDRGIRHRRYRAQALAREIETYADAQGLVLREPYRDGPADAAHQAWLWLRDRDPTRLEAFLQELFRAYWMLELDAADPDAVAKLLSGMDLEGDAFLSWSQSHGAGVAEALAAELREFGLFQVPAYVVEDEVFYGRQHLAMVRWVLEGRSGPVPI